MRTIGWFFMGLGFGVAMGTLYSPGTGVQNRNQIKKKTQEGTDYVKRTASQGAEYVKRQGDELKKSAAVSIERGKAVAMAPVEKLAEAVDVGKQAYNEALRKSSPSMS